MITDYDENYFNALIANPDFSMPDSFREGIGYQEGSGEQALLQVLPLFLEVGLLAMSEAVLKMLPQSTLRSYYVLFLLFSAGCFTNSNASSLRQQKSIVPY